MLSTVGRPPERRTDRAREARAALLFALVLLLSEPADLTAQGVEGRLLDARTDEPIPAASVFLLDLDERSIRGVLTDSAGFFSLEAPGAGRFRLRAGRIGYREATSAPFDVGRTEVLEVELRLSIEAVALAPLTVITKRHPRLDREGFYERRREYGENGLNSGQFLDRSEIERMPASYVSDVLQQLRGVRAIRGLGRELSTFSMRRGCKPDIYVNGMVYRLDIDDRVSASTLVGVELYTGYPLPVRFYQVDPKGAVCGVIVLWTGPS